MPFIHTGCGGSVNIITGKCNKCHKKFKPSPTNPHGIPDHVFYEPDEKTAKRIAKMKAKVATKGTTKYAKWADKAPVPGVSVIASHLPNIPRWARILVTVGIAVGIIFLIRSCV